MEIAVGLEGKMVQSKTDRFKFEHPIFNFLPLYSLYRALKTEPKWEGADKKSAIAVCAAKEILYLGFPILIYYLNQHKASN